MTNREFEDLVQITLNMAMWGFYRKDFFGEFGDRYTRKELTGVLNEAKRRGMYSIPDMRDQDRGTYYQY